MSKTRSQKPPLKIVEISNQGEVHLYGSPVFKSLNPPTVKKMSSLTDNVKWISPDPHFKSNNNARTLRTSSQENNCVEPKKCNTKNTAKPPTEVTPLRSVLHKKLDFIKDTKLPSCNYDSDDNKENISPGSESQPKPVMKKQTISKSKKTRFSGRQSNRLNRI